FSQSLVMYSLELSCHPLRIVTSKSDRYLNKRSLFFTYIAIRVAIVGIFVACSLLPAPNAPRVAYGLSSQICCSLSYKSFQSGGDKIILSFSNAITGVNRIFFCNLSG
ncbi:hypothetical protein, partial [Moorena bouillonii]|uniref:hypothetical protein n=1 Tax=Moorena bouillonii TaxID=207920 RepID=UPI001BE085FB